MRLKVMSWNMAGAKVFEKLDAAPAPAAGTYIRHFHEVWENRILRHLPRAADRPDYPDIILLQECLGFVDHRRARSGRWQTGKQILQAIFSGYEAFFFPGFSSHSHPNPARWKKFRQGGGAQNFIPDEIEAQQGYGVCVRDISQLRRLWVDEARPPQNLPDVDRPTSQPQYDLCFEAIHTTTGLYLGSRDTEPRLVVLGRLKLPDPPGERYVNFLNVHLTTLKGEREGNIRRDRLGSRARMQQLDLILDNVISPYQEADHRMPRVAPDQKEDTWVIAGDFNATPDSGELELARRVGFVDGNPDKHLEDDTQRFQGQIGTKWSLNRLNAPPIATDYIMCGIQGSTFPEKGVSLVNSRRPYKPGFPGSSVFEPDHAMLFASFDIG
jgi:endonuclease/exonuclease/phosphatase family metal-dependent hydrolase